MQEYIDCYWLVDTRNIKKGEYFLDYYLPSRIESSDDYPIPQFSDVPDIIFTSISDILNYLNSHPMEEYILYWRNLDTTNFIRHGMLFFTDDKKMIFGISVEAPSPQDKKVQDKFLEIMTFLKASIGCITIEEVAPTNSFEFINFCKSRYSPVVSQ